MDEMIEPLIFYFKKVDDVEEEEATNDNMLCEGDYWEFKEPKEVEAWSLKMVPHRDNMHLNMKYKKSPALIPVFFNEKVKKIADNVYLDKQYHFTLLVNFDKIFFNIFPFLESLEPMPYVEELKQLEEKMDTGKYNNQDGSPLTVK